MASRAGVVAVDLEPNLPALGSRIDAWSRSLKPFGLKVDIPEFGANVDRQAGESRRALDGISTDRARGQLKQLGDSADREIGRIGLASRASSEQLLALGAGSIFAGSRILSALRPATDAASSLNETVAYSEQVFGSSARAIDAWSNNSVDALAQSKREATDAANTFATFGKAAGLAGGDLVDFSTQLVQLATDLASAKDTTPAEAVTAIGAALRGETEPIRAYGVLLDDASVRQEALALGIVKTTKEALTPQQRVLAVNSLLFKQTADAQGDYARTADSAANSQRRFNAEAENAKADAGKGLLGVLSTANDIATGLLSVLDKIPGATTALGAGVALLGGAAIVGGGVSTAIGAWKQLQQLRSTATTETVAANETITATSVEAAAATSTIAAAYDRVAASATRAAESGAAASAGSSVGGFQFARERAKGLPVTTGGAIGAIDVTGVEKAPLALGAGAEAASKPVGKLKADLSGVRGEAATMGTVGSRAFGALGTAAQAVGGILAVVGIAETVGAIANELRGLDQASRDAMNQFAGNISGGRTAVITAFDEIANAADASSSVGDVVKSWGREFSLAGVTAVRDIEYFQQAFDQISTTRPVAESQRLIDSLRAQNDLLPRTSVEYRETTKLLDKWQRSVDLAAKAQEGQNVALGGTAEQLTRLGIELDENASKWANYSTVLGGIFDPINNALGAQRALVDGQEAVADAQQKYADIVNGNTEGLRSAAEGLSEARDALNEAVANTGPGSRAARDAAGEVRDALRQLRELQVEAGREAKVGDYREDRSQDIVDQFQRVLEAQQKLREIESGNSEEVAAARDRVTEAQARYNEELGKTGPNSKEAADALKEVQDAEERLPDLVLAVEQAQARVRDEIEQHPDAIQASIDKVDEWVAKGLISEEVARRWKEELFQAALAAKALTDNLPDQDRPGGGPNGGPQFSVPQGPITPQNPLPGRSQSDYDTKPKPTTKKPDNPKIITIAEGRAIGLGDDPMEYSGRQVYDNKGRPWVWSANQSRWYAKFATGGVVKRPPWIAPSGGDVVPAMLTEGEGVVTTKGMAAIGGEPGLAAINSGAGGADVVGAIDQLGGRLEAAQVLTLRTLAQAGPGENTAVLREIADSLRRIERAGRSRSARDVRAGTLEFA